jgi:signal transduction histidine kinase
MLSLLFLILVYGFATFPMQKDSLIEVMHSEAKTLANSISLVCEDAMVNDDDSFIVEHNLAVIEKNPKIYNITVTKRDGTIIKTQKGKWEMLDTLPPQLEAFQKQHEVYDLIEDNELGKKVFQYSTPVIISGIEWGWIHIDFSLAQYHKNITTMYLFLLYLTLASVLIVLIVSYALARYILEPLLELTDTAKAVSKGNLNIEVPIRRNDEIGDLARDFNLMIKNLAISKEKLRRSHEELEKRVRERTHALAEKSKELEELNKNLDRRVKEESEKSRKNEQLLIQQSRQAAMGEMIGNIAHQWRQPLNALGLVLQNIYFSYQMDELDDEFMEKSIEKGKKLTTTMSKTIDDFRDFFKPNKLKEHFMISDIVHNTIDLIDASFKNHNITLETELDDTLELEGYPSEFSQVLLNILSNAKDALLQRNPPVKTVKIKSYHDGKHMVIEISDNAGGIPADVIERIFDPYFTTKEEGKGTGIGLYMSKTIIEQNMDGYLQVQNNDKGAVFTITFQLQNKYKNADIEVNLSDKEVTA